MQAAMLFSSAVFPMTLLRARPDMCFLSHAMVHAMTIHSGDVMSVDTLKYFRHLLETGKATDAKNFVEDLDISNYMPGY